MKITIVRHGQTDDNINGIMQGRRNVLMNDSGRRQCKMLRMKLEKEHFDYCYMSPLTRAVETAMILIGDKVEMIPDKRIIERDMGELDGKPREMYNAYKYWNYDYVDKDHSKLYSESTPSDEWEKIIESEYGMSMCIPYYVRGILERCDDFLNYLKEKYKDESILIVTHEATYRALRHLLRGDKLKGNLLDGKIDNCACEVFEYK